MIHYFKNFPKGVSAGVVQDDVLTNPPFLAQTLNQVHGTKIIQIDEYGEAQDGDAMFTDKACIKIMIKTADCIPLVFADVRDACQQCFGVYAVHAGWRGLTSEIISKTIELMAQRGANPSKIKVGIGPSICKKCAIFTDAKNEIPSKYHFAILGEQGENPHNGVAVNPINSVDLNLIAKTELLGAGILQENIEWMEICTSCDKDWFSWRRDKTQKRFGTFIELLP